MKNKELLPGTILMRNGDRVMLVSADKETGLAQVRYHIDGNRFNLKTFTCKINELRELKEIEK